MKRLTLAYITFYLLFFVTCVSAQNYTAVGLGTLGGNTSAANSINNEGLVVGKADLPNGYPRAVLFGGGGAGNTDLGALTANGTSEATKINDQRTIVGYSPNASGFTRGVIFSGNGTNNTALGTLGGLFSYAYSVNNNNKVVGEASKGNAKYNAILYPSSDLGSFGGDRGSAYSINNLDVIVGSAYTTGGKYRAALFSGTGTNNFDLGVLSGDQSWATSINDAGQIVGYGYVSAGGGGFVHAILFSGTGVDNTDLGTLGGDNSVALGINTHGVIVGNSNITPGSSTNHGFIYSDGVMTDINTILNNSNEFLITDIRAINDAGQMAAVGSRFGGPTQAIRLDPSNAAPTPTPTPISVTTQSLNLVKQITTLIKTAKKTLPPVPAKSLSKAKKDKINATRKTITTARSSLKKSVKQLLAAEKSNGVEIRKTYKLFTKAKLQTLQSQINNAILKNEKKASQAATLWSAATSFLKKFK